MCGNCCRFNVITLTPEDIKRMEDVGLRDFVEETASGEKKLRMLRGRCMFVKEDKCSIYANRPEVCRNFPFQKMLGIPYAREWSCCTGMTEFKKKLRG
jgi:Fe-S-cluster containining protein